MVEPTPDAMPDVKTALAASLTLLLLISGCQQTQQNGGLLDWSGRQQLERQLVQLRSENQQVLTELQRLKQENRQLRQLTDQPVDLGPAASSTSPLPASDTPAGIQEIEPLQPSSRSLPAPALPVLNNPNSSTSEAALPGPDQIATQLSIDPGQSGIRALSPTENVLVIELVATDARGQLVKTPAAVTVNARNAVATAADGQIARWELSQSEVSQLITQAEGSYRIRTEFPWPANLTLPAAIEVQVQYQQPGQVVLEAELLLPGMAVSRTSGRWTPRDEPGGAADALPIPSLAVPLDRALEIR